MAADTANSPSDAPLHRDGTMDEALSNGLRLLKSHPQMALQQAQAILRQDRANTAALRLAAAAHRALEQPEQAVNAEMAAIAASERIPALAAAAQALGKREFGEASQFAADHLRQSPGDLAAMTLSAEAAIALGLPDKGEPLLREVLNRAPPFLPARMLLLNALMLSDQLTEARAMLLELIEQRPDDIQNLQLLWRIESELGNHAAAATASERILDLDRESAEHWVSYGDSLRFSSRKTDAVLAYRRAIGMDPGMGRAWWSLADIDPQGITDDDIARMERALADDPTDPERAGNLNFALGLAHDARKQSDKAFPKFAAGNDLRRKAQPYDPDEITGQVDRHLQAISAAMIPPRTEGPANQPIPIFIVGMPRSGSTLVERMLGRHSMIEGLGELSVAPHMIQRMKLNQDAAELEGEIASLQRDKLDALGAWYLARASEHRRTEKPYFVDKLHMNWRHLPLIMRMLPQARIIDVRRNALDCCWSNYKTLFARGHPAASDLTDIGRFYSDYVRLTDSLRELAPGRIHLIRYEALVADIGSTAESLFDAIGLPLEPQCLDFHLSQDPVATASSEQVRRPLNREGLGVWRPYEPWLRPLKQALGPLSEVSLPD